MNYFCLIILCLVLIIPNLIKCSFYESINPFKYYLEKVGIKKFPGESLSTSVFKRDRSNDYSSNLIVESVTENSVVIRYDGNTIGNDFEYKLRVKSLTGTGNESIKYLKLPIKTLIKVEGLIPGGKYLARLYEKQTNAFQMEKKFVTKPKQQKNYESIERGHIFVSLRWTEPDHFYDKYVMMWSRKHCISNDCFDVDFNETSIGKYTNNFTLTGLHPGALYTILLHRTSFIDQQREFSERLLVLITTMPYSPTNVVIDSLRSYSFGMYWDKPRRNCEFSNYNVKYGEPGSVKFNTELINNTWSDRIHYIATKHVKPGRTYDVSITTVSMLAYYSAYKATSKSASIQITTPPLPVENLRANVLSNSDILVDWTSDVESVQDFYLVKYYLENDSGNDFRQFLKITNSSIIITNLLQGQIYVIEVFAVSKDVTSEKILTSILMKYNGSPKSNSPFKYSDYFDDTSDDTFENDSQQEIQNDMQNNPKNLKITNSIKDLGALAQKLKDGLNELEAHINSSHKIGTNEIDLAGTNKPSIINIDTK